MFDMFNLNSLRKIGVSLYLFIYLIFPYSATSQTKNINLGENLENALNSRNLRSIKENFRDNKKTEIIGQFSKIIKEFPNAKWKITKLKTNNENEYIFKIKVVGEKSLDGDTYILESNFNYLFSILNGKINEGNIKKLFTVVRNDNKEVDIIFKLPDEVLTGAKYDIDIILNEPLEEVIIAGGIKPHQIESLLDQEIDLEPLVSGGIFKMTRAPSQQGMQIWSGVIAHPKGVITFTKSIEIVEKI